MDNYRIKVITSYVAELAALLALLVGNDFNYSLKRERATLQKIRKRLEKKDLELLILLSGFRLNGFEILEFLLEFKIYDDIFDFTHAIHRLSEDHFIFLLFGEEIQKKVIQKSMANPSHIDQVFNDIQWMYRNKTALKKIIKEPEIFRNRFIEMLTFLDSLLTKDPIQMDRAKISDKKEGIIQSLKASKPLDLSQEIMEKKFMRISPYKEYVFIPCHFHRKRPMRFMDDTSLILIQPTLNPDNPENNERVERSNIISRLKVIADATRFEILCILSQKPLYGKQLADILNRSTPTISHHLEQLKAVGLIQEEKVKNIKYFSTSQKYLSRFLHSVETEIIENGATKDGRET